MSLFDVGGLDCTELVNTGNLYPSIVDFSSWSSYWLIDLFIYWFIDFYHVISFYDHWVSSYYGNNSDCSTHR
jgi:hypothetical protein